MKKMMSLLLSGMMVLSLAACSGSETAKETTKVRLEYAMGYVKADGRQSRKIFQISEILLKENQKKTYIKKHSFSDLRTRKHYPGTHSVTLIVNGAEQDTLDFELTI